MSAADTAALMFLGVRTDPGDGVWQGRSVHGRAEIHQTTGMGCFSTGVAVSVPDLADEAWWWPVFVVAVAERGADRSVHALPLRLRGEGDRDPAGTRHPPQ